jgi:4'-phosphopantetheinyl transferase
MKLTPRVWNGNDGDPVGIGPGIKDELPETWLVRLSQEPVADLRLLSLLSPDERGRYERFHRRDDQRRFVLGRGLLRLRLGEKLGVAPETVVFAYGPLGKPTLSRNKEAPAVHFNVSHSGDLVALAFSSRGPIGIDVEEERPESEWAEVAAQTLSSGWSSRPLVPEGNRAKAFYTAWTRQEAGLKAMGVGLGGRESAAGQVALECFDLELPPGYHGAVALAVG